MKPNLDTLPVPPSDRIDDNPDCPITIKKEENDEKPIVRKWMTEDDVGGNLRKKVRKNPDVDTSFLPDREREESENRLREGEYYFGRIYKNLKYNFFYII